MLKIFETNKNMNYSLKDFNLNNLMKLKYINIDFYSEFESGYFFGL